MKESADMAERRGRRQAIVFAAGWLAKTHDLPSTASELLALWGITKMTARKNHCDKIDVDALIEKGVFSKDW